MDARLIIVTAPRDKIAKARERIEPESVLSLQVLSAGRTRQQLEIVVDKPSRQSVIDTLQTALGRGRDWTLAIVPVDAVLPPPPEPEAAASDLVGTSGETREELMAEVGAGARLNADYLTFTVLATVVAAIGLLTDNVAVIIGAMVIAPLLGPNLAFALGVALGDTALMRRAMMTGAAGLALALVLSAVIGLALGSLPNSHELMARTDVGLDGLVLALASGAAAAMSLTSGLSGALVGVMVAVALLPPAATAGMMLGARHWPQAEGALMLLAVNVVSVNLAAQVVFVLRRVTPRTWYRKKSASRAVRINLIAWGVLAGLLALLLLARTPRL